MAGCWRAYRDRGIDCTSSTSTLRGSWRGECLALACQARSHGGPSQDGARGAGARAAGHRVGGLVVRGLQRRTPLMDQALWRAERALELVHGDFYGPVAPATLSGNAYSLLLVDDCWHFLSRYRVCEDLGKGLRIACWRSLVQSLEMRAPTRPSNCTQGVPLSWYNLYNYRWVRKCTDIPL